MPCFPGKGSLKVWLSVITYQNDVTVSDCWYHQVQILLLCTTWIHKRVVKLIVHFICTSFHLIYQPPSRKSWWTSKPIKLWPPNLATFPKNIWEHFKVVVTCASTLMLPWQPSFWSHVFQNLHLFLKNRF